MSARTSGGVSESKSEASEVEVDVTLYRGDAGIGGVEVVGRLDVLVVRERP